MQFDEFTALCGTFNVIPMARTLLADMHTPVSAYLALRQGSRSSFLFESAEPNERIGRHSFIGADPVWLVRSGARGCEVVDGSGARPMDGNIFDVLRALSERYRQAPLEAIEGFTGGFVGYLGYDTVRHLERIPRGAAGPGQPDEAVLGLFDTMVRFDHMLQTMTIIHNVVVAADRPLREQFEAGRQKLDTLELRLRRPALVPGRFTLEGSTEERMSREAYCEAVRCAKERIVEGDIFQVVLSRRVEVRYSGDLFPVYRALRVINPSPYLFFLDFGDTALVGSSPELLLKVQDGTARVLPIAGTRRRGTSDAEDRALEEELLQDQKELAEHIMLVDLGRNDVGRIAQYGSVEVPILKRVERYSHVMHLVSEVTGKLQSGRSALDALTACFPAGTVSGAPKVRAMEIISELEPVARGAYAGAVGYIGFNGSLDTCIAIRTIIAHDGLLAVQAGAGIVADSVPEREYDETVNKSRALLEAVEAAARGLRVGPGPRFA
ncbi:MAG TPA: anthranilate synthase component I [Bacteroidota bacterium]